MTIVFKDAFLLPESRHLALRSQCAGFVASRWFRFAEQANFIYKLPFSQDVGAARRKHNNIHA